MLHRTPGQRTHACQATIVPGGLPRHPEAAATAPGGVPRQAVLPRDAARDVTARFPCFRPRARAAAPTPALAQGAARRDSGLSARPYTEVQGFDCPATSDRLARCSYWPTWRTVRTLSAPRFPEWPWLVIGQLAWPKPHGHSPHTYHREFRAHEPPVKRSSDVVVRKSITDMCRPGVLLWGAPHLRLLDR